MDSCWDFADKRRINANSFESIEEFEKKIIGGNPNVARRFTAMTRQTGFPPVDSKSYPVLPLLLFKKKKKKEIRSIGGKREKKGEARSNKQLGRKGAKAPSFPFPILIRHDRDAAPTR